MFLTVNFHPKSRCDVMPFTLSVIIEKGRKKNGIIFVRLNLASNTRNPSFVLLNSSFTVFASFEVGQV